MALNLVCAVLDRGPSDPMCKLALLAIADSADKDTGEAWPSLATISARACVTPRRLRDILKRLRADGWLTWQHRQRPNGSQASSLYTVNLHKLGEAPRSRATENPADGARVGGTQRPPLNLHII